MCECIVTSRSMLLGLGLSYINYNYNNNNISLLLPRRIRIRSMYQRSSITSNPNKLYYTKASASDDIQQQEPERERDDDDDDDVEEQEQKRDAAAAASSRPNFLQFDDNVINGTKSPRTDGLNFGSKNLNSDADVPLVRPRISRKRQTMNRSSIVAKQVITIRSAITMGFVSQLWLDPSSWLVLVAELRPSLLSGHTERFLMHDICQVGDVVLVQDESVTENEINMAGLETLVSTYALFVEDVLEVVSDTVVVHEAAASRIQRLTKGFWDAQKAMKSMDEFGGFPDLENSVHLEYNPRRPRSSPAEKLQSEVGEMEDNWELPMDYL
ncbi:uncharacterized protein LOC108199768 isoform X2 [Daucus carota subsp. sativus]|uniref:uncharacterized protein LOC108199768 isoform X2 n=1 Tax=Daucus carota subsp. sativus TaxID=79200 RepID=UPI003082EAA1